MFVIVRPGKPGGGNVEAHDVRDWGKGEANWIHGAKKIV